MRLLLFSKAMKANRWPRNRIYIESVAAAAAVAENREKEMQPLCFSLVFVAAGVAFGKACV